MDNKKPLLSSIVPNMNVLHQSCKKSSCYVPLSRLEVYLTLTFDSKGYISDLEIGVLSVHLHYTNSVLTHTNGPAGLAHFTSSQSTNRNGMI